MRSPRENGKREKDRNPRTKLWNGLGNLWSYCLVHSSGTLEFTNCFYISYLTQFSSEVFCKLTGKVRCDCADAKTATDPIHWMSRRWEPAVSPIISFTEDIPSC